MKKKILKTIFIVILITLFITSSTIVLGQLIVRTRQKDFVKEINDAYRVADSRAELGEGIADKSIQRSSAKRNSNTDKGNQIAEFDSAEMMEYDREIWGEMPPYKKVSEEEKEKIAFQFGLPKGADVVGVDEYRCLFYWGEFEIEYTKFVIEKKLNMEDLELFAKLKSFKGKMIITYDYNAMERDKLSVDNQYIVHINLYIGKEEYCIDINPLTNEIVRYISYPSTGNTEEELRDIKNTIRILSKKSEEKNKNDAQNYNSDCIPTGVKEKYKYAAYSYVQDKFGTVIEDESEKFDATLGEIEAVNGERRLTITIFCTLENGKIIQVVIDEAKAEVIGYIVNPFL